MNNIENLREKLYRVIEDGNSEDILHVSQELDILILGVMKEKINSKRLSV